MRISYASLMLYWSAHNYSSSCRNHQDHGTDVVVHW